MRLKVKRVRDGRDLALPAYQTRYASGLDLLADVSEDIVLKKGERSLIPTGIAIELEPGFEAQVRPRSGLAVKYGVALLNAPGTIDADYRGEIKVILINLGDEDFTIRRGDRVAQLVVAPVVRVEVVEVSELNGTDRGARGFGSTGS